jgi:predicted TPR repeat methyltransferase
MATLQQLQREYILDASTELDRLELQAKVWEPAAQQMLGEIGIENGWRAIDLGCGTGLMGARLRDKVETLVGIDLSAAMVAETARKGIYDHVEKAELVAFLATQHETADLITAADVFIYCGALPPVLDAVVPALRPGGRVRSERTR